MTNYPTNISPNPRPSSFDCTLTSKYPTSVSCTLTKITTGTITDTVINNFYIMSCSAITDTTLDPGYNNSKCYDDMFSLSCPITYTINSINYGAVIAKNFKICLVNIPKLSFLSEVSAPNLQVNPNTDFIFDLTNYIDMSNLLQGLIYKATNDSPNSSLSMTII